MSQTSSSIIHDLISALGPLGDAHLQEQYAWWLLEHLTGKRRIDFLRTPIELSDEQKKTLASWIHELTVEHKPLQYILGSVPFGPLTIAVRPPILIPRHETEEWCLTLGERLAPLRDQPLRILDLCTGSGCIALLLQSMLPHAQVMGIDIDPRAIELARENAERNDRSRETLRDDFSLHSKSLRANGVNNFTPIRFIQSDLFDAIQNETFDLIVSNPPYIDPEEKENLESSVTGWENPQALFAEDHGLALIKKIIDHASAMLAHHENLARHGIPNLFIEIGHGQGAAVLAYAQSRSIQSGRIIHDAAGKERVFCGNSVGTKSCS